MTKLWNLLAAGNNNLGVAPGDLTYFGRRFNATPLSGDWSPPPLEYLGKSKKLRDFVSWVVRAPLVSERAATLIQQLAGGDVELLPFHELKGKPYFALNVLRTEAVIDLEKSNVHFDPKDGTVINVFATVLLKDLPSDLPPIFKDWRYPSDVFVTEEFANMAVENKLTGLALHDPEKSAMQIIVSGQDLNDYPGIIT